MLLSVGCVDYQNDIDFYIKAISYSGMSIDELKREYFEIFKNEEKIKEEKNVVKSVKQEEEVAEENEAINEPSEDSFWAEIEGVLKSESLSDEEVLLRYSDGYEEYRDDENDRLDEEIIDDEVVPVEYMEEDDDDEDAWTTEEQEKTEGQECLISEETQDEEDDKEEEVQYVDEDDDDDVWEVEDEVIEEVEDEDEDDWVVEDDDIIISEEPVIQEQDKSQNVENIKLEDGKTDDFYEIFDLEERNDKKPEVKERDSDGLIYVENMSLRDFVKKNRNCSIEMASKYFDKKEILKHIKIGKISKRGNKLSV